jgi:Fe2+ or Zn2+ uptake regulation protein
MEMHTDCAKVGFSIVCRECATASEVESNEQAFAEGWSEIDYAPRRQHTCYAGLCPDCRETFEHWPTNEV